MSKTFSMQNKVTYNLAEDEHAVAFIFKIPPAIGLSEKKNKIVPLEYTPYPHNMNSDHAQIYLMQLLEYVAKDMREHIQKNVPEYTFEEPIGTCT